MTSSSIVEKVLTSKLRLAGCASVLFLHLQDSFASSSVRVCVLSVALGMLFQNMFLKLCVVLAPK